MLNQLIQHAMAYFVGRKDPVYKGSLLGDQLKWFMANAGPERQ